jgi:cell wall-associated NlpC family hydrolase
MKTLNIRPGVLVNMTHKAMHSNRFEKAPRMCLRFVRQVVQAAGGNLAWPVPQGYNAEESRQWFVKHGYAMPEGTEPENGDIVFKAPTEKVPEGHVGIVVSDEKIGENSSTSLGRVDGAKGYRTRKQFGEILTIVRPK